MSLSHVRPNAPQVSDMLINVSIANNDDLVETQHVDAFLERPRRGVASSAPSLSSPL
jgi:hypothetical protein